jgi:hypothetical protein
MPDCNRAEGQDLTLTFARDELAAALWASFLVAPQVVNTAGLDAAVVAPPRFSLPLRNTVVSPSLDQDRYR